MSLATKQLRLRIAVVWNVLLLVVFLFLGASLRSCRVALFRDPAAGAGNIYLQLYAAQHITIHRWLASNLSSSIRPLDTQQTANAIQLAHAVGGDGWSTDCAKIKTLTTENEMIGQRRKIAAQTKCPVRSCEQPLLSTRLNWIRNWAGQYNYCRILGNPIQLVLHLHKEPTTNTYSNGTLALIHNTCGCDRWNWYWKEKGKRITGWLNKLVWCRVPESGWKGLPPVP
jgi:hypothetical protein